MSICYRKYTLPSSSAVLRVDEDDESDEINLCSVELAEILADGPISRVTKSKAAEKAAFAKDEVENEDEDGIFELNESTNQCRQKCT